MLPLWAIFANKAPWPKFINSIRADSLRQSGLRELDKAIKIGWNNFDKEVFLSGDTLCNLDRCPKSSMGLMAGMARRYVRRTLSFGVELTGI
jgi:hypothetical protein